MKHLFTILVLIMGISITIIIVSVDIMFLLIVINAIKNYIEEIIRDWKYNAFLRSRRRLSSLDDERSNQG